MGFNAAGFCNALKAKCIRLAAKTKPEDIIKWLRSKNIYVRGHCLIWPGSDSLPTKIARLLKKEHDTPEQKRIIRTACAEIVRKAAKRWDVDEWDVINEPRGKHDIQDAVGYDIEAEWFKIAAKHARNPGAKLALNENKIISASPTGRDRRKGIGFTVDYPYIITYRDNLRRLLDEGAPITMLGFQSRFGARVPPDIVYKRLCVFDEFNLPISATEFEIKNIQDKLLKAQITEEVMTVYFSHPLVQSIYAWTLFPNSKFEGREILNADGTPNLRGKIWLYLTKNRWTTRTKATTGGQGTTAPIRAFKGRYRISVTAPDRRRQAIEADALKDCQITVKLP